MNKKKADSLEKIKENEPEIEEGKININVTEQDTLSFKRLDHFLSKKVPQYSRTFLKSLFLMDHINIESDGPSKLPKLEDSHFNISAGVKNFSINIKKRSIKHFWPFD